MGHFDKRDAYDLHIATALAFYFTAATIQDVAEFMNDVYREECGFSSHTRAKQALTRLTKTSTFLRVRLYTSKVNWWMNKDVGYAYNGGLSKQAHRRADVYNQCVMTEGKPHNLLLELHRNTPRPLERTSLENYKISGDLTLVN